MVMSVKTRATVLCDSPSSYERASLLLGLLMTIYLSFCDGTLARSEQIFRVDNTTLPETTIGQGTLRGINMVTRNNRSIFGFIGIPYAQPPVGELRFKAPLPPGPWNGTLDASSDTEPCPQFDDQGEVTGDEDCLHLNVYTPRLPARDNSTLPIPVIMYITGGGFYGVNNSMARFAPHLLLDEDVVLVVPNYRVGVLGYLSTGDEVSPGNYGLKDAVRALEWIRDNIENFGGDPNQVTLSGGSSGAMSVHLLALSSLTDGLIHRYITQSGSALSSLVNQPKELYARQAIQLGEHLGCPTNTSTVLVDCLRDVNVSQLLDAKSIFYEWKTYPVQVWLPTDEPDIEGALLTDLPVNLYATGNICDLPRITTVTRDEGMEFSIRYYKNPDLFEELLENLDFALPYILGYHNMVGDKQAYTDALKSYYLNDLAANRSLLLKNFTTLAGDATFIYPAYRVSKQHLTFAKSSQYFGLFAYIGTYSHSYSLSGGSTEYSAAVHGDEIIYLYGNQIDRYGPADYEYNEADHAMIDNMVSMWTSFAINGTPTTPDYISTAIWEPFSSLNNYLQIGNDSETSLEMKYNFFTERMQFWDELTRTTTTTVTSGGFRNHLQVLAIVLSLCLLLYTL